VSISTFTKKSGDPANGYLPYLRTVTDSNAPGGLAGINGKLGKPGFIAAFGNRLVVSIVNSSEFHLSAINLVGNGATPTGYFDPAKCFTNYATPSVFAQEDGIIRQFGVLNSTLYIFTDYVTGVWANIPVCVSDRRRGCGCYIPMEKELNV
jgi:hypothetical protein